MIHAHSGAKIKMQIKGTELNLISVHLKKMHDRRSLQDLDGIGVIWVCFAKDTQIIAI
jgi:hypothetical protein